MGMPGRKFSLLSDGYRYGFNGKERDHSTAEDNYDYGARIYDGRIGRFLSVDPLQQKFPDLSPYVYVNDMPIANIDAEGKYAIFIHYILTKFLLKQAGASEVQARMLAHYASVYADNPGGRDKAFSTKSGGDFILLKNQGDAYKENPILNDIGGPLTDQEEKGYFLYQTTKDYPLGKVDYSGTKNSQSEDYDAQLIHGTRTFSERNFVSAENAVNRSMSEAWNRLFSSASVGIDNMTINSEAAQNFGRAIHTFQDIEAHRGTVFRATFKNLFGLFSKDGNDHNLDNDSHPDKERFGIAKFFTSNAILVHQIMSGNLKRVIAGTQISTQGMSADQIGQLKTKLNGAGFEFNSNGSNTYMYSVKKKP